MTIQKKSLISTLQTAKKANVASAPLAEEDVKGTKGVKLVRPVRIHNTAKFVKASATRMAKATRLARKARAARLSRMAKA
jgi:hypothetical protein